MSVKSTVINSVKDVKNSYSESIANLQTAYKDSRFTDYGKNEYTKEVLDALSAKIHENLQTVTELTNAVAAQYVERDAAMVAKTTNNTEYQMLFSYVMQQLPEILKCSEQIIAARLAMFKNDPVAREKFIEKKVPFYLLPEYSIGKASELCTAIQKRLNVVFLSTKRAAEELAPYMLNLANQKALATTATRSLIDLPTDLEPGKGQLMMLDSLLSYLEGFNEDCTEFDASKVDREKAGYEIMSGRDFAGEIAKKYGGMSMYDLVEAANKAAFDARFRDENGNYIYANNGNGGATLFVRIPDANDSPDDPDTANEPNDSDVSGTEPEDTGDSATDGTEPEDTGDSATDGTEPENTGETENE